MQHVQHKDDSRRVAPRMNGTLLALAQTSDTQRIDPEQCTRQYLPLVRRMAGNLKRLLPPSVGLDDLVQFGMLGLLRAINRYQGTTAKFQIFAMPRIRGAMLEGLPALDSAPLELRRKVRRIRECTSTLEQKLARMPSNREIAGAIGVTLEDYQRTVCERDVHHSVTLDASTRDLRFSGADDHDPLEALQHRYAIDALDKALGDLPKREQLMLELRYRDDVKLDAIGVMFGVSESRVCQMLKHAMARLRAHVPT
jgi:RNA polymerase sigma factor for flagellar operon FliA